MSLDIDALRPWVGRLESATEEVHHALIEIADLLEDGLDLIPEPRGRLDDRIDAAVDVVVLHHDLHLHLGQEVDDVLGPAIELGVALLPAEALDLGDGQAGHPDLAQGLADLLQLERFDDGGDLFHGELRKRS